MLRPFAIALGACLATLLVAELVCRCLPVSSATMSGYYQDPDLLTYPAGQTWTTATGWDLRNPQRNRANNLGFSDDHDFVPDHRALALIGDSYVEANMLDHRDRPAAQLAAQLHGGRPVYGLGSPGTALLDYAQRIRFASQRLQVRDFVVWIEAGDARQSFCGSGHVHSRCLDPRSLKPRVERIAAQSTYRRWLRHSALAQYLVAQLKLDPMQLPTRLANGWNPKIVTALAPTPDGPGVDAKVDAVMDEFLAKAEPYLQGRVLFIVDGHRDAVPARPTPLEVERRRVIQALQARGFQVLDLEPVFAAHRARSQLALQVGPYDHHLNALGVRLVMTEVARQLGR